MTENKVLAELMEKPKLCRPVNLNAIELRNDCSAEF